jgi:hypothetical protein
MQSNTQLGETYSETARNADEMLLSDPERAIGFGALSTSLEIFFRWFSSWCEK